MQRERRFCDLPLFSSLFLLRHLTSQLLFWDCDGNLESDGSTYEEREKKKVKSLTAWMEEWGRWIFLWTRTWGPIEFFYFASSWFPSIHLGFHEKSHFYCLLEIVSDNFDQLVHFLPSTCLILAAIIIIRAIGFHGLPGGWRCICQVL